MAAPEGLAQERAHGRARPPRRHRRPGALPAVRHRPPHRHGPDRRDGVRREPDRRPGGAGGTPQAGPRPAQRPSPDRLTRGAVAMIAGWRRIDMPANGAAKRPSAPPLVQGAGTPPSGDEWEKLFSAVAPRYRYEDLVVPAAVQAQLDNALARVRCHPIVYEAWGMKAKNPYGGGLVLNLYGPPGTGKTHAAEAIAHRLGRLLIDIDYAALISKYVGDTGKAIAGAFRAAERTGAVLVFNEGDTVLTSRLQRPANSADKGGNDAVVQMLRTLERFQGVVIFTSNLFASYDSA